MKGLYKKVLIIVSLVLAMGVLAALPGFADTQDELKKIFVTRDEFNLWAKGSEAKSSTTNETGISQILSTLEKQMQQTVQSMVKVEMSRRGIKDNQSSSSSS